MQFKSRFIPNTSDNNKKIKYDNDSPQNQDVLAESVLNPLKDNTQQVFKDISQQLQKDSPTPVVNKSEPIPCHIYPIMLRSGVLSFPFQCRQVVVYNPTPSAFFLSDRGFNLDTTGVPNDYVIKVNATKLFVLPYWPISMLSYFTNVISANNDHIVIYAYGEAIFTPTVSSI